jgi:hypothetical protein
VPDQAAGAVERTEVGSISASGARTHYAVDVTRGDTAVARVIVLDTSLKALDASGATQNPIESQLTWLKHVLETKAPGQQAVVVSNTPMYSYGPGQGGETEQDASTLEAILAQYHVNLVVSGRLGWNGLFWTTAPGLHAPCSGESYPDPAKVPEPQGRPCGQTATGADAAATGAQAKVSRVLQGAGAPPAPQPCTGRGENTSGVIPNVVAASSGGGFGPDNRAVGSAVDGYWHGYTIVRLDRSGDPRCTIVEQRPIFDWIDVSGSAHLLRPGQKMRLRGFGREPLGADMRDQGGTDHPMRYDVIAGPSITHRYDLIEADPRRPWLPRVVADNGQPHGYVTLSSSIATIDDQTGQVMAQTTSHGRVFALAVLSVGDKAASWPMVFEPRRSYTPPAQVKLGVPDVPAVKVLGFQGASLAPPQTPTASSPPPPINTSLQLPAPPSLPGFPTPVAPPIAPPAPPAPPPPPGGQQGLPINVAITPVGITVPPTTGVTAQPTPPVNPSPPGGARKEAKQRQAATAKSEESGGEGAGQTSDALDSRTQPMTRRTDPLAYTRRAHAQPSAWVTGLQWGGGIGLMALTLALGFTTARPTPRRRPPVMPVPAWARRQR